jgi:hypothetical protein
MERVGYYSRKTNKPNPGDNIMRVTKPKIQAYCSFAKACGTRERFHNCTIRWENGAFYVVGPGLNPLKRYIGHKAVHAAIKSVLKDV